VYKGATGLVQHGCVKYRWEGSQVSPHICVYPSTGFGSIRSAAASLINTEIPRTLNNSEAVPVLYIFWQDI